MKCFLGVLNFLEEISSLSHPIISSISFHHSLKKAFLSFLAFLWNSALRWIFLSLCLLPFASHLFSVRPPQTTTLPSCISVILVWNNTNLILKYTKTLLLHSSFHSSFLYALIVTNYTSIHYAPITTDLKLLFYAIAF